MKKLTDNRSKCITFDFIYLKELLFRVTAITPVNVELPAKAMKSIQTET